MAGEIAVKVEHVSKTFKLPHEKQSSVKGALINLFRKGDRSFERQQVLQDISFEVEKGEFFGIVGRNGSGKSTLLKLLAGIYTPDKGTITINGKVTPFIELGVGFNPELTGRENVFLNGALLGFNRKEMEAMYDDIVMFAEIGKFMDQKLKNYSSGMQVRLAFSIAIRAQSDILILDEVLAVGDVSFQEKCFDVFRDIKKTGRTVIFVSHDLASVQEFCDRVVLIDRGVQVEVGDAKKVIVDYETRMAEDVKIGAKDQSVDGRPGSGKATVDKVSILDSNSKPARSVREGEAFSIEIAYTAKDDIDSMVCGLSVDDKSGASVYGPNTMESNVPLRKLRKGDQLSVVASFADNILAAGSYSVTVGLFDSKGAHPYDYYSEAATFKVLGKARHGKTTIEPHWTISQNTK